MNSIKYAALGTIVFFAAMTNASAADAPSSSNSQSLNEVEEVVVTAQKRTESLQIVPISVSVVSGTTLQERNIGSIQDLTSVVPGLHVATGGDSDQHFLRGIGSGDSPSFDQSVGTFIDDMYYGRSRLSAGQFLDIERAEILNGPQSIYFGNNSIAGAINITTRKPGKEFEGYARTLYDVGDNGFEFEGAVTVPITDKLRIRAAGIWSGGDGYLQDFGQHINVPRLDNKVGRLTAVWTPTDNLTGTFKVEAAYMKRIGDNGQFTNCPAPPAFGTNGVCGPVVALGQTASFSSDYKYSSPGSGEELRTKTYEATFEYALDNLTLTSVTGFTKEAWQDLADASGSTAKSFYFSLPEQGQQFSQEIRISTPKGEKFEFVGGLYYQFNRLNNYDQYYFAFLSPTIAGIPPFSPLTPFLPLGEYVGSNQNTNTYSGFVAVTWNVLPELRVTAALRESIVRDDFTQRVFFGQGGYIQSYVTPLPGALAPLGAALANAFGLGVSGVYGPLSRTDRHLSPSFNAEYDVADNIMAYFTYANGFKAGGFDFTNTVGDASKLPFAPEEVDSYELGVKSRLFDGSVVLNGDIFRSEYSNLQVDSPILTGNAILNQVRNAASAVSQGLEVNANWKIDENWGTSLAVSLVDAHYGVYLDAPPTPVQQLRGATAQTLSGHPTEISPNYSGSWNLNYTHAIFDGFVVRVNTDLYFSDKFNYSSNNDPFLEQGAYAKLDARVSLTDPTGTWEFSVIGRNLTDALIATWGVSAPAANGSYIRTSEHPQDVAFQLRYTFGGGAASEPVPEAYVPPPAVAAAPAGPKSYLVFFDFNKSNLTPQAVAIIDKAAKNADRAKATKLEVTGHTDTVGSDAYNMRLSRRRAESVAAQLVKDGVSSSEIEIVAKGKHDLLVPTADGVKEPQNRRVQIVYEGGPTS